MSECKQDITFAFYRKYVKRSVSHAAHYRKHTEGRYFLLSFGYDWLWIVTNVYLISFQNHTIFSCQILLSDYLVRIREAIYYVGLWLCFLCLHYTIVCVQLKGLKRYISLINIKSTWIYILQMLLNNSLFSVTYMKLIISSFASFHKSSGHSSLNWAFLAPTSNIFAWSHNITPVVCVRSSNSIWNGCFLLVLVIGQTNANELWWFRISLLKTSAGLLPICSWPFWGLKSITIMSPCL